MAAAKDTVVGGSGLERLTRLTTVNIHQKSGGFKGNKYMVLSEGEQLFYLKENGHALTFLSRGHSRGFRINGVDTTGRNGVSRELELMVKSPAATLYCIMVFSLRRPSVFISDKVELYMNNTLVSVVRKMATFITPLFSINDAQDSPVLRIKGEFRNYNFEYNDDYVITFPADLDVCFKLSVIGACILIDYRYHEG